MSADKSCEALLRERAGSPSYTPSRRDLDGLIDLYVSEVAAEVMLARALLRAPDETFRKLVDRLPLVSGSTRARLVRLLSRLYAASGDRAQCELLAQILAESDEQSVRQAAHGLGKSPPELRPDAERALLARLDAATELATVRALVDNLGKVGGPSALTALRALHRARVETETPIDAELSRLLKEAMQRLTRDAVRVQAEAEGGGILIDALPPSPLSIRLGCRAGLGEALADELQRRKLVPRADAIELDESDEIAQPSLLYLHAQVPLSTFFPCRLWSELAIAVPMPEPTPTTTRRAAPSALSKEAVLDEVARAASQPSVVAALRALTRGPVRYRIRLNTGGHQRAFVKELGQAIGRRAPLLQNDPQDSLWQLELELADRGPPRLAFVPRLPDPRFSYRRGDVPAASHPTVAAALAWVAKLREGEVIWDPFVGSGTELIEAAQLCPSARLYGSDLSPRALAVAQENLTAAGVMERAELREASALERPPAGVTLVLTNPPMGRRVRVDDTADLLSRFVTAVGRMLPTTGRLVWITPHPLRTERRAQLAGLGLRYAQRIDMNGFWARLEVWEKEPS